MLAVKLASYSTTTRHLNFFSLLNNEPALKIVWAVCSPECAIQVPMYDRNFRLGLIGNPSRDAYMCTRKANSILLFLSVNALNYSRDLHAQVRVCGGLIVFELNSISKLSRF